MAHAGGTWRRVSGSLRNTFTVRAPFLGMEMVEESFLTLA